jgi:WD40 repeat protein
MIVAGGWDKKVWRWDAISGEPIGGPLDPAYFPTGAINSIAIGLVEDRPMIVSGWRDGTIERWDALSGRCLLAKEAEARWRWAVSHPIDVGGGRYPIRAIAIGTVQEQPVIVTGGDDDVLRCRHAVSGELLGNRFVGSQGLRSLALGVVDGRAMIVSGGANGQVLCWDARSGEFVTGWHGAVDRNQPRMLEISSVAIGAFEGRPLIVSGAHNGAVVCRVGWGEETVWMAALVDFQVKAVAILPNGRVAVAGDAGLMVLDFQPTA